MTDVAEIARSLPKAQREALDRLCANFIWADGRSVKAVPTRGPFPAKRKRP